MNMTLIATYAQPLADLSKLLIDNRAASAVESEARDSRKGGLVDSLRALAILTHRDDVPAQDASDMLRFALSASTDAEGKPLIPTGTVKNYCAAMRGYRKMLGNGRDISDVSTADATAEVASEEQKRIKAAKAEFGKLTKKWNADAWERLVADNRPAVAETEATDEEVAEVEEEAAAA